MRRNMTNDRRGGLVTIIKRYYQLKDGGITMLSSSDFDFLHEMWETEIDFYGTVIQKRLNKIRELYLKYEK